MHMRLGITASCLATAVLAPSAAHAFGGFYITGAGGEMFNNATQVVLMRSGTREHRASNHDRVCAPTSAGLEL